MTPTLIKTKGKLGRMGESSRPVLCFGMVVAELFKPSSQMEMTVELQVGDSPEGPFGVVPEGNGQAKTTAPRNLAFVSLSGQPFYARLQAVDARSWTTPVQFTLTTIEPPPPPAPVRDEREVIIDDNINGGADALSS